MVGTAVQDYLKAIFKLRDLEGLVAPSAVAARMEVSPAAVSKMVKRMTELNLVQPGGNHRVGLTPAGEKIALEVIRHHRLLETYLMQALGYSWDQVDVEAEKLEHHISEEFEDRIDALLGYPTHDPHGDPIPTRDGRMEEAVRPTVTEMEPGQEAVIRRVSDRDPAMLRYMGTLGLYPNTPIEMVGKEPYGGPLRVRVSGAEHVIGQELANNLFIEPRDGNQ